MQPLKRVNFGGGGGPFTLTPEMTKDERNAVLRAEQIARNGITAEQEFFNNVYLIADIARTDPDVYTRMLNTSKKFRDKYDKGKEYAPGFRRELRESQIEHRELTRENPYTRTQERHRETYINGEMHSVHDRPSLVVTDVATGLPIRLEWHKHGYMHREDNKPAEIVFENGEPTVSYYFQHGNVIKSLTHDNGAVTYFNDQGRATRTVFADGTFDDQLDAWGGDFAGWADNDGPEL